MLVDLLHLWFKGQSALEPRRPGHYFSHFEKRSPQPDIRGHLKINLNFRSILFDFQSFTEKLVFECLFIHPMILFLSCLVKISMDRVSVVCRLAMKWYLMRKCASWLWPFKSCYIYGQILLHLFLVSIKFLRDTRAICALNSWREGCLQLYAPME